MLSLSGALLDPRRLFAGFDTLSGLLLAVSGGPDSLALMRLAARWRDFSGTPLFVATVDHGLRQESAAEARRVGEWAGELGLPHAILPWTGEKPKRAIQEKAREARYALLFEHAAAVGAQAVATAHHADDQWETVVFRLARGSGVGGLAGMARDQIFPGGRVIRPLLGLPKQALVDFCRAEGLDFFVDPANTHPAFARTRLRALAKSLSELGFNGEKAATLAERAKRAEETIEWAGQEIFQRTFSPEKDVYHLQGMENAPRAALERFLRLVLHRAAGQPPLRLDRLENLAEDIAKALASGDKLRATFGGCVWTLTDKAVLGLREESPRRRGRNAPDKARRK